MASLVLHFTPAHVIYTNVYPPSFHGSLALVDLHNRLYDDHAYDLDTEPMSWWRDSCAVPQFLYSPLQDDRISDVAVIGGGVTGLNAALRLARDYGQLVTLLDSGYPGWGASGRNGGFCCLGGSRLSELSIARSLGAEEAHRFQKSQLDAILHVEQMLDQLGLDVDRHSKGELVVAHSPRQAEAMREEAPLLAQKLGVGADFYSPSALKEQGAHISGHYGGLHLKAGFAMHPLKYTTGLATACHEAGVRLCGQSDVLALSYEPTGRVRVHCLEGSVLAKRVLLATNGYSSERCPPVMAGRTLPLLSTILVTRPLSKQEQQAQGWWSDLMAYDSRNLLHYFRLMPDGRFLFGMRGSCNASEAGQKRFESEVRKEFNRLFPAWAGVEHDYFWSGLICMTASGFPYIGPVEGAPNIWAALGYHGNGLAMGSWAGAQAADILASKMRHDALPAAFRQPLKTFPFPALRKLYIRAGILGLGLLDQLP
ncbi:MAG: FAD-binding oxidoreductase [Cohaesibacter sp.]|nr:FAD-binding oxidoreductase [Cohaesibacter sp.]